MDFLQILSPCEEFTTPNKPTHKDPAVVRKLQPANAISDAAKKLACNIGIVEKDGYFPQWIE